MTTPGPGRPSVALSLSSASVTPDMVIIGHSVSPYPDRIPMPPISLRSS